MHKHHETSAPVDTSLKEIERLMEADRLRQQKFEAKAYAKGMRWAVDACIHPEQGGDDRSITIYFNVEPTEGDIRKHLKKQRSCRLDDHGAPRELKDPNNIEGDKTMTTKQKLAELNRLRAANNMNPLKAWKQSVAKLDAAINALNFEGGAAVEEEEQKVATDPKPEQPKAEPPKQKKGVSRKAEGPTVREVAERLILEKDADGQGLPYSEILRRIFVQFPKAKTSIACLRWYATHMRTDRGIRVPDRPNSKNPQRELAKIAAKKGE
jgi:hypothetical protein